MKSILFIAFMALAFTYCNTPEPATTDPATGTTTDTTTTTGTDTTARRSDTLRLP
ncbi:MAG TPA: hypothetical protein VD996_15705 [Chitinophagaceae bacterium]|nr:hypothetical protein [Chitinophagaceae bacterium]